MAHTIIYLLILFIPMWDIRPHYYFFTCYGLERSLQFTPIVRPISDSSAIIDILHVVLDDHLIVFLWVSIKVLPLVCDLVTFSKHGPTISFCVSGFGSLLVENVSFCTDHHRISYLARIYCISSVDIWLKIHPACAYYSC